MALILPNDLANGQDADGDKLQQNFTTIENWGNSEAIVRDGSTSMVGALLLAGPPTQPNQAATKEYADSSGAFIGEMRMYGADTPPNASWLLCQGQAISRTTYATLFGLVGVRFGAGDTTTTFNLPDMRGQYGCGAGGAYGTTVGTKFGTKDAIVVEHSHAGPSHTHGLGAHTHTGTTGGPAGTHYHLGPDGGASLLAASDSGNGVYGGFTGGGIAALYYAGTSNTFADAHVHTFGTSGPSAASDAAGTGATSIAGANGTNYNLPPSVSVNYIMKVQ